MNLRLGTYLSLLMFAGCQESLPEENQPAGKRLTMGKIPAGEIATWRKVGASNVPDERYLHAAVYDESRKVMVVFGGMVSSNFQPPAASQELWEYDPARGAWTNRTPALIKPSARSGAGMVFDSTRNKVVIFGGRAGSGYNLEDTWEWDPATGAFTERTTAGNRPAGRSQHCMVYEKSTGKILLFGGGRSDPFSLEGFSVSQSFADTWEWEPKSNVWSQIAAPTSPSPRHDSAMVWDAKRNMAVLFGGISMDTSGISGNPKQDTWEFDPVAGTWTDRTAEGNKPSARYAHSMAFLSYNANILLTAGFDIGTGGALGDVWEWNGTTGVWDMKLAGTEPGTPPARLYGTLVSDPTGDQLWLFAGLLAEFANPDVGVIGGPIPIGMYGATPAKDIWQFSSAKMVFQDRTAPLNSPGPRANHAQAYCPASGKTYVFGGRDEKYAYRNDMWEWDGQTWTKVDGGNGPSPRPDSAMAYDPARKSLILFGGQAQTPIIGPIYSPGMSDTWEFNCMTHKWVPLKTMGDIEPLYAHGMVTDYARNKILLFGGMGTLTTRPSVDGGIIYREPMRRNVWEWDGVTMTWTNRTPIIPGNAPTARQNPIMSFDPVRQKLVVFDGNRFWGMGSNSVFWEWDAISSGWALRDNGDYLNFGSNYTLAYDSNRRRHIFYTDAISPISSSLTADTWELEPANPIWYVRAISGSPGSRYLPTMTFDSGRNAMVLFGGEINGIPTAETWEYQVTNLANGAGCTLDTAPACASGNCVNGVCCGAASCGGPCQSCAVPGKEGTCSQAAAGTEVPGSCEVMQACDGKGDCKTKNGQACKSSSECASNFCVDGVCCNNACDGTCKSCNLPGSAGICSPYQTGTDPQNECSSGSSSCRSTCNGVDSCAYAPYGASCGTCMVCDGFGSCSKTDPLCGGTGGIITRTGGVYRTGGIIYTGGIVYTGGITYTGGVRTGGYPVGGAVYTGGYTYTGGVRTGGIIPSTGAYPATGGFVPKTGGVQTGGTLPRTGGYTQTGGARAGGASPAAGGARTGGSGAPGTGGSMYYPDGGFSDDPIATGRLHRSGCYCDVGSSITRGPGLPFGLIGLALVGHGLRRRRRR